MTAGRPIRRSSLAPISSTMPRSIRSFTMLDTVALLRPVPEATSAREHGAFARMYRTTTARFVSRTSVKSTAALGPDAALTEHPLPRPILTPPRGLPPANTHQDIDKNWLVVQTIKMLCPRCDRGSAQVLLEH